MASRFASVSEEGILSMNEEAVPRNTKMATAKIGITIFNGKLFNLSNLIFYGEESKYNAMFTKPVEH